jgi:lysophospholipase L1-like esterase
VKTSLRTILTAALAGAALAAPAVLPTAAATPEPLSYVALGDSFAASPLVPPADHSHQLCLRSLADYPHITAKALHAQLTDVSCSGATVGHFRTAQYPGTAPQYDALTPDTDIVSVTIGGNDTGLLATTLSCMNVLPKPAGTSCAAENTVGGTDRVKAGIDAWAPAFDTALNTIRQRAPHAQVFVVGYGNYLRPGGCFPTQPLWDVDADYIQREVNHLSATLQHKAERHDATFVDTYALGTGHDACAAPADRYTEGLLPTHSAAPLHPNAHGAKAVASALAAAIRTAPVS